MRTLKARGGRDLCIIQNRPKIRALWFSSIGADDKEQRVGVIRDNKKDPVLQVQ